MTAPREGLDSGLPKCIRLAVLDDRTAHFIDKDACGQKHWWQTRFRVGAGPVVEYREYSGHGCKVPGLPAALAVVHLKTDDPTEAEAAWVKAEHFVRTGELP